MMLIVQYKNDKWAPAQREFNNPRICFWAAKREKLITRKYQRLQYHHNNKLLSPDSRMVILKLQSMWEVNMVKPVSKTC